MSGYTGTGAHKDKNVKRRRSVSVCVRMSAEEKRTFDRNAREAGLTRAEYFIRNAVGRQVKVIGSPGQLSELIYEMNKIGVNINQIAKKLNEGNSYIPLSTMFQIQRDFSRLVDEVAKLNDE